MHLLANVKIGYDIASDSKDPTRDRIQASAAIISLITGNGFFHSSLATSLVERRMAFLLDYRYDDSQLLVTYPVEPVLSSAALVNFQKNALDVVRNLLASFSSSNIGEIGEMVLRMLFLLCIPPKLDTIEPYFPVRDFLESLLGSGPLKMLYDLKNKDALAILDGYICLSSFTKMNKLSDNVKRNIGLGVMFNSGFCTPNNFGGLDTVIPVVLSNGQLASINVQGKSYAGKLSNGEANDAMSRLSSVRFCSNDIPRLSMLINVTPCENVDILSIFELDGRVIVHIEGLFSKAFPHIPHELKSLLQILLEFGRLERNFKGEKLTRVPETRDVDKLFERLNKNSVDEAAVSHPPSSNSSSSRRRKKPRT